MNRIGRIVLWEEHEVDDSVWMPLIVFLARAREERVNPELLFELDFRDFMLMNGVERKPRPFLYIYKHCESRRHVNLDRDGSPYRFLPVGEHGQYRATSFHRAIWQLDPLFIREARCGNRGDRFEDDLEDATPWEMEPSVDRQLRVVR